MQAAQSRHILEHLRLHSQRTPDKPFVVMSIGSDRRSITYAQAWRDILAVRARLAAAGVAEDGVALLFMPQGWEALAYYFGAIAHGCTASFMPSPSPKQDADLYWASHVKLMARITPAALITTAAHEEQMRRNGLLVENCVMVRAAPIAAEEATGAGDAEVAAALIARPDSPPGSPADPAAQLRHHGPEKGRHAVE